MEDLTGRAARRLYEVSRDLYAPVLAAFGATWLDELACHPDGVAVCLGRDGLTAFLAARTLLRAQPRRFHGVHPRRVRLAYISRPLAVAAVAQPRQAALLDGYLRAVGAGVAAPLILVDVGIHGSIQDMLQGLYPRRRMCGRYLVLRRRAGDPHGAAKRGFLAELDVAPAAPFALAPSWPPPPGWAPTPGGTLRDGDPLFLRRRSVHVLEDLWSGVGEAAAALRAEGGRVVAVRPRPDVVVAFPPGASLPVRERAALKRAALRGVVDGVARGREGSPPRAVSAVARGLAAWFRDLEDPDPVDAHILRALVRVGGESYAADETEM